MKFRLLSLLFATTLFVNGASTEAATPVNPVPLTSAAASQRLFAEAMNVLHTATKGTLYSLEPTEKPNAGEKSFHNYKILGRVDLDPKQLATATDAFESARASGKKSGFAMCTIQPRHALSLTVGNHTYDYLLCFACGQLEVVIDDQEIAVVNAGGPPDVLNNLLTSANIPLSQSGIAEAARKAEMQKKDAESHARWLAAMPKLLQPLWAQQNWQMVQGTWPDASFFEPELDNEFPELTPRILALLTWYGSGAGPWSGYPAYEMEAASLLQVYSTADLVAALQAGPLSDAQEEGAARLLAGSRSNYDLSVVPKDILAKLVEHMSKSANANNMARAEQVLGPISAVIGSK